MVDATPDATVDAPTEAAEATDALGMSVAQLRALGHWLVDRVADHAASIHSQPAIAEAPATQLLESLGGPVPEAPADPLDALRVLADHALAFMQHGDHPRYFARVPGPSSFTGILGDWLGTGFNAMPASWGGGSGPSAVELVALRWLGELLGLPPRAEGVLVSGGSVANLMGLRTALDANGPGVCYLTGQTHASIRRDLRVLGVVDRDVRVVATDAGLRMDVAELERALDDDRASGARPSVVVATAGTTNTGAVDDLERLAACCRARGLWLHVDAAYGGPVALVDPSLAAGLGSADSVVTDPHKWLFQPYDCGCLFVLRPGALTASFAMNPEYLVDSRGRHGEVDLRDRGIELTRRARGLKLWLTLRTHGAERLRGAVRRGLELAEHAERRLREDDRWEVVTPAQLGIVTFARRGVDEGAHGDAARAIAADGYAAVTSTVLGHRHALRLCTINPRTTPSDLDATIDWLAAHLDHGA